MDRILASFVRYMDSVSTRLGKVVMWGPFLIIAVQLNEGISRTFFNAPRPWSLELSMFILGVYMFLAAGFTLIQEGHIRMDVFYARWSPRKRAIFDLATFPLAAVYLVVIIFGGVNSVQYALRVGQYTATQWGPPLAPIKILLVVACILFLLQIVSALIRDIYTIRGRALP